MTWLKVSDAFAMHPMLLQVLEFPEADDRMLNEMAGFLTRCSSSAAAYETDYILTQGMVQTMAGSFARNKVLCSIAVAIGIFTPMKDPKGRIVYKLIEEEDLFNMIYKAERLWRNQRKNDNRNPKLTAPVRKRDGDECRWCGKIVNWSDRKSAKGGTYDHLNPGQGAATPDEMVVSCNSCNSERKDATGWNKTLRPVPETPYYSKTTVTFLAKANIRVKPSDSLSFEVEGAEETISLVPVELEETVDPASVESVAVEPEISAPAPTTPDATAPESSSAPDTNESFNFSFENMEEDIANAPEWVQELYKQSRPTAHETSAPQISGRFGQISRVTDLDMPGRDGTGKEKTIPIENRPSPGSQSTSMPKPKRRRRRRRPKKSNGE